MGCDGHKSKKIRANLFLAGCLAARAQDGRSAAGSFFWVMLLTWHKVAKFGAGNAIILIITPFMVGLNVPTIVENRTNDLNFRLLCLWLRVRNGIL